MSENNTPPRPSGHPHNSNIPSGTNNSHFGQNGTNSSYFTPSHPVPSTMRRGSFTTMSSTPLPNIQPIAPLTPQIGKSGFFNPNNINGGMNGMQRMGQKMIQNDYNMGPFTPQITNPTQTNTKSNFNPSNHINFQITPEIKLTGGNNNDNSNNAGNNNNINNNNDMENSPPPQSTTFTTLKPLPSFNTSFTINTSRNTMNQNAPLPFLSPGFTNVKERTTIQNAILQNHLALLSKHMNPFHRQGRQPSIPTSQAPRPPSQYINYGLSSIPDAIEFGPVDRYHQFGVLFYGHFYHTLALNFASIVHGKFFSFFEGNWEKSFTPRMIKHVDEETINKFRPTHDKRIIQEDYWSDVQEKRQQMGLVPYPDILKPILLHCQRPDLKPIRARQTLHRTNYPNGEPEFQSYPDNQSSFNVLFEKQYEKYIEKYPDPIYHTPEHFFINSMNELDSFLWKLIHEIHFIEAQPTSTGILGPLLYSITGGSSFLQSVIPYSNSIKLPVLEQDFNTFDLQYPKNPYFYAFLELCKPIPPVPGDSTVSFLPGKGHLERFGDQHNERIGNDAQDDNNNLANAEIRSNDSQNSLASVNKGDVLNQLWSRFDPIIEKNNNMKKETKLSTQHKSTPHHNRRKSVILCSFDEEDEVANCTPTQSECNTPSGEKNDQKSTLSIDHKAKRMTWLTPILDIKGINLERISPEEAKDLITSLYFNHYVFEERWVWFLKWFAFYYQLYATHIFAQKIQKSISTSLNTQQPHSNTLKTPPPVTRYPTLVFFDSLVGYYEKIKKHHFFINLESTFMTLFGTSSYTSQLEHTLRKANLIEGLAVNDSQGGKGFGPKDEGKDKNLSENEKILKNLHLLHDFTSRRALLPPYLTRQYYCQRVLDNRQHLIEQDAEDEQKNEQQNEQNELKMVKSDAILPLNHYISSKFVTTTIQSNVNTTLKSFEDDIEQYKPDQPYYEDEDVDEDEEAYYETKMEQFDLLKLNYESFLNKVDINTGVSSLGSIQINTPLTDSRLLLGMGSYSGFFHTNFNLYADKRFQHRPGVPPPPHAKASPLIEPRVIAKEAFEAILAIILSNDPLLVKDAVFAIAGVYSLFRDRGLGKQRPGYSVNAANEDFEENDEERESLPSLLSQYDNTTHPQFNSEVLHAFELIPFDILRRKLRRLVLFSYLLYQNSDLFSHPSHPDLALLRNFGQRRLEITQCLSNKIHRTEGINDIVQFSDEYNPSDHYFKSVGKNIIINSNGDEELVERREAEKKQTMALLLDIDLVTRDNFALTYNILNRGRFQEQGNEDEEKDDCDQKNDQDDTTSLKSLDSNIKVNNPSWKSVFDPKRLDIDPNSLPTDEKKEFFSQMFENIQKNEPYHPLNTMLQRSINNRRDNSSMLYKLLIDLNSFDGGLIEEVDFFYKMQKTRQKWHKAAHQRLQQCQEHQERRNSSDYDENEDEDEEDWCIETCFDRDGQLLPVVDDDDEKSPCYQFFCETFNNLPTKNDILSLFFDETPVTDAFKQIAENLAEGEMFMGRYKFPFNEKETCDKILKFERRIISHEEKNDLNTSHSSQYSTLPLPNPQDIINTDVNWVLLYKGFSFMECGSDNFDHFLANLAQLRLNLLQNELKYGFLPQMTPLDSILNSFPDDSTIQPNTKTLPSRHTIRLLGQMEDQMYSWGRNDGKNGELVNSTTQTGQIGAICTVIEDIMWNPATSIYTNYNASKTGQIVEGVIEKGYKGQPIGIWTEIEEVQDDQDDEDKKGTKTSPSCLQKTTFSPSPLTPNQELYLTVINTISTSLEISLPRALWSIYYKTIAKILRNGAFMSKALSAMPFVSRLLTQLYNLFPSLSINDRVENSSINTKCSSVMVELMGLLAFQADQHALRPSRFCPNFDEVASTFDQYLLNFINLPVSLTQSINQGIEAGVETPHHHIIELQESFLRHFRAKNVFFGASSITSSLTPLLEFFTQLSQRKLPPNVQSTIEKHLDGLQSIINAGNEIVIGLGHFINQCEEDFFRKIENNNNNNEQNENISTKLLHFDEDYKPIITTRWIPINFAPLNYAFLRPPVHIYGDHSSELKDMGLRYTEEGDDDGNSFESSLKQHQTTQKKSQQSEGSSSNQSPMIRNNEQAFRKINIPNYTGNSSNYNDNWTELCTESSSLLNTSQASSVHSFNSEGYDQFDNLSQQSSQQRHSNKHRRTKSQFSGESPRVKMGKNDRSFFSNNYDDDDNSSYTDYSDTSSMMSDTMSIGSNIDDIMLPAPNHFTLGDNDENSEKNTNPFGNKLANNSLSRRPSTSLTHLLQDAGSDSDDFAPPSHFATSHFGGVNNTPSKYSKNGGHSLPQQESSQSFPQPSSSSTITTTFAQGLDTIATGDIIKHSSKPTAAQLLKETSVDPKNFLIEIPASQFSTFTPAKQQNQAYTNNTKFLNNSFLGAQNNALNTSVLSTTNDPKSSFSSHGIHIPQAPKLNTMLMNTSRGLVTINAHLDLTNGNDDSDDDTLDENSKNNNIDDEMNFTIPISATTTPSRVFVSTPRRNSLVGRNNNHDTTQKSIATPTKSTALLTTPRSTTRPSTKGNITPRSSAFGSRATNNDDKLNKSLVNDKNDDPLRPFGVPSTPVRTNSPVRNTLIRSSMKPSDISLSGPSSVKFNTPGSELRVMAIPRSGSNNSNSSTEIRIPRGITSNNSFSSFPQGNFDGQVSSRHRQLLTEAQRHIHLSLMSQRVPQTLSEMAKKGYQVDLRFSIVLAKYTIFTHFGAKCFDMTTSNLKMQFITSDTRQRILSINKIDRDDTLVEQKKENVTQKFNDTIDVDAFNLSQDDENSLEKDTFKFDLDDLSSKSLDLSLKRNLNDGGDDDDEDNINTSDILCLPVGPPMTKEEANFISEPWLTSYNGPSMLGPLYYSVIQGKLTQGEKDGSLGDLFYPKKAVKNDLLSKGNEKTEGKILKRPLTPSRSIAPDSPPKSSHNFVLKECPQSFSVPHTITNIRLMLRTSVHLKGVSQQQIEDAVSVKISQCPLEDALLRLRNALISDNSTIFDVLQELCYAESLVEEEFMTKVWKKLTRPTISTTSSSSFGRKTLSTTITPSKNPPLPLLPLTKTTPSKFSITVPTPLSSTLRIGTPMGSINERFSKPLPSPRGGIRNNNTNSTTPRSVLPSSTTRGEAHPLGLGKAKVGSSLGSFSSSFANLNDIEKVSYSSSRHLETKTTHKYDELTSTPSNRSTTAQLISQSKRAHKDKALNDEMATTQLLPNKAQFFIEKTTTSTPSKDDRLPSSSLSSFPQPRHYQIEKMERSERRGSKHDKLMSNEHFYSTPSKSRSTGRDITGKTPKTPKKTPTSCLKKPSGFNTIKNPNTPSKTLEWTKDVQMLVLDDNRIPIDMKKARFEAMMQDRDELGDDVNVSVTKVIMFDSSEEENDGSESDADDKEIEIEKVQEIQQNNNDQNKLPNIINSNEKKSTFVSPSMSSTNSSHLTHSFNHDDADDDLSFNLDDCVEDDIKIVHTTPSLQKEHDILLQIDHSIDNTTEPHQSVHTDDHSNGYMSAYNYELEGTIENTITTCELSDIIQNDDLDNAISGSLVMEAQDNNTDISGNDQNRKIVDVASFCSTPLQTLTPPIIPLQTPAPPVNPLDSITICIAQPVNTDNIPRRQRTATFTFGVELDSSNLPQISPPDQSSHIVAINTTQEHGTGSAQNESPTDSSGFVVNESLLSMQSYDAQYPSIFSQSTQVPPAIISPAASGLSSGTSTVGSCGISSLMEGQSIGDVTSNLSTFSHISPVQSMRALTVELPIETQSNGVTSPTPVQATPLGQIGSAEINIPQQQPPQSSTNAFMVSSPAVQHNITKNLLSPSTTQRNYDKQLQQIAQNQPQSPQIQSLSTSTPTTPVQSPHQSPLLAASSSNIASPQVPLTPSNSNLSHPSPRAGLSGSYARLKSSEMGVPKTPVSGGSGLDVSNRIDGMVMIVPTSPQAPQQQSPQPPQSGDEQGDIGDLSQQQQIEQNSANFGLHTPIMGATTLTPHSTVCNVTTPMFSSVQGSDKVDGFSLQQKNQILSLPSPSTPAQSVSLTVQCSGSLSDLHQLHYKNSLQNQSKQSPSSSPTEQIIEQQQQQPQQPKSSEDHVLEFDSLPPLVEEFSQIETNSNLMDGSDLQSNPPPLLHSESVHDFIPATLNFDHFETKPSAQLQLTSPRHQIIASVTPGGQNDEERVQGNVSGVTQSASNTPTGVNKHRGKRFNFTPKRQSNINNRMEGDGGDAGDDVSSLIDPMDQIGSVFNDENREVIKMMIEKSKLSPQSPDSHNQSSESHNNSSIHIIFKYIENNNHGDQESEEGDHFNKDLEQHVSPNSPQQSTASSTVSSSPQSTITTLPLPSLNCIELNVQSDLIDSPLARFNNLPTTRCSEQQMNTNLELQKQKYQEQKQLHTTKFQNPTSRSSIFSTKPSKVAIFDTISEESSSSSTTTPNPSESIPTNQSTGFPALSSISHVSLRSNNNSQSSQFQTQSNTPHLANIMANDGNGSNNAFTPHSDYYTPSYNSHTSNLPFGYSSSNGFYLENNVFDAGETDELHRVMADLMISNGFQPTIGVITTIAESPESQTHKPDSNGNDLPPVHQEQQEQQDYFDNLSLFRQSFKVSHQLIPENNDDQGQIYQFSETGNVTMDSLDQSYLQHLYPFSRQFGHNIHYNDGNGNNGNFLQAQFIPNTQSGPNIYQASDNNNNNTNNNNNGNNHNQSICSFALTLDDSNMASPHLHINHTHFGNTNHHQSSSNHHPNQPQSNQFTPGFIPNTDAGHFTLPNALFNPNILQSPAQQQQQQQRRTPFTRFSKNPPQHLHHQQQSQFPSIQPEKLIPLDLEGGKRKPLIKISHNTTDMSHHMHHGIELDLNATYCTAAMTCATFIGRKDQWISYERTDLEELYQEYYYNHCYIDTDGNQVFSDDIEIQDLFQSTSVYRSDYDRLWDYGIIEEGYMNEVDEEDPMKVESLLPSSSINSNKSSNTTPVPKDQLPPTTLSNEHSKTPSTHSNSSNNNNNNNNDVLFPSSTNSTATPTPVTSTRLLAPIQPPIVIYPTSPSVQQQQQTPQANQPNSLFSSPVPRRLSNNFITPLYPTSPIASRPTISAESASPQIDPNSSPLINGNPRSGQESGQSGPILTQHLTKPHLLHQNTVKIVNNDEFYRQMHEYNLKVHSQANSPAISQHGSDEDQINKNKNQFDNPIINLQHPPANPSTVPIKSNDISPKMILNQAGVSPLATGSDNMKRVVMMDEFSLDSITTSSSQHDDSSGPVINLVGANSHDNGNRERQIEYQLNQQKQLNANQGLNGALNGFGSSIRPRQRTNSTVTLVDPANFFIQQQHLQEIAKRESSGQFFSGLGDDLESYSENGLDDNKNSINDKNNNHVKPQQQQQQRQSSFQTPQIAHPNQAFVTPMVNNNNLQSPEKQFRTPLLSEIVLSPQIKPSSSIARKSATTSLKNLRHALDITSQALSIAQNSQQIQMAQTNAMMSPNHPEYRASPYPSGQNSSHPQSTPYVVAPTPVITGHKHNQIPGAVDNFSLEGVRNVPEPNITKNHQFSTPYLSPKPSKAPINSPPQQQPQQQSQISPLMTSFVEDAPELGEGYPQFSFQQRQGEESTSLLNSILLVLGRIVLFGGLFIVGAIILGSIAEFSDDSILTHNGREYDYVSTIPVVPPTNFNDFDYHVENANNPTHLFDNDTFTDLDSDSNDVENEVDSWLNTNDVAELDDDLVREEQPKVEEEEESKQPEQPLHEEKEPQQNKQDEDEQEESTPQQHEKEEEEESHLDNIVESTPQEEEPHVEHVDVIDDKEEEIVYDVVMEPEPTQSEEFIEKSVQEQPIDEVKQHEEEDVKEPVEESPESVQESPEQEHQQVEEPPEQEQSRTQEEPLEEPTHEQQTQEGEEESNTQSPLVENIHESISDQESEKPEFNKDVNDNTNQDVNQDINQEEFQNSNPAWFVGLLALVGSISAILISTLGLFSSNAPVHQQRGIATTGKLTLAHTSSQCAFTTSPVLIGKLQSSTQQQPSNSKNNTFQPKDQDDDYLPLRQPQRNVVPLPSTQATLNRIPKVHPPAHFPPRPTKSSQKVQKYDDLDDDFVDDNDMLVPPFKPLPPLPPGPKSRAVKTPLPSTVQPPSETTRPTTKSRSAAHHPQTPLRSATGRTGRGAQHLQDDDDDDDDLLPPLPPTPVTKVVNKRPTSRSRKQPPQSHQDDNNRDAEEIEQPKLRRSTRSTTRKAIN